MPPVPNAPEGPLEYLAEEAESLIFPSANADDILRIVLVVGAVFLSLVIFRLLRRARTPVGARISAFVSLGAATLGTLLFLELLGRGRPRIGLLAVALPILALVIDIGRRIGPWAAGFGLIIAGRLRIGDFLSVGDMSGTLDGVGLLRARLVNADGALAHIPWSYLAGAVVSRPSGAPRVARIHIDYSNPPSPEERRQLEVRAALCPYRVWSHPVVVRTDPERPERLDVELWSWSEESARLAEDFLRRAAARDAKAQTSVQ